MVIQAADGAGGGGVVPSWLPWILVGSGVGVLLLVGVMLLRGRSAAGGNGSSVRAAGETADLKHQLIEVKKLAATVADDLDRRAERLERLIAQADEALERSARTRSEDGATTGGRTRATGGQPLAPVDDLTQRVFALADQGRTPVQIAQALRQPVGNIELMLALRGER